MDPSSFGLHETDSLGADWASVPASSSRPDLAPSSTPVAGLDPEMHSAALKAVADQIGFIEGSDGDAYLRVHYLRVVRSVTRLLLERG